MRQLILPADSADNEVRHNGSVSWSGGAAYRVGGVASKTDGALVIPFRLPQLASGEQVLGGSLEASLSRVSNGPSGSVTLSGLKRRSSSAVLGSDFRQGAVESGAWSIQTGFATGGSSSGRISSSSAASAALAAYVNAQYAAGAKAGDWIFHRLSPSQNESDFRFWEFDSANSSRAPQLVLQVGAGGATSTPAPTPAPTPTPEPAPTPAPTPDPAPMPPAAYRVLTVRGDGGDNEVRSNGSTAWVNEQLLRIGGSGTSVDSVGVFRFQLPVLQEGEAIVGAMLTLHQNRISSVPAGSLDLYGIKDSSGGVVDRALYYSGGYDGDSSDTAWPLQKAFATNSTASGFIDSSEAASDPMVAFLTEQYLDKLGLGTSVFFRLNSSSANENDHRFWEFSTANRSRYEPMLTLEIASGLAGSVPNPAVASPKDQSVHLETDLIRFALDERLRTTVQDIDEVIWHSSHDGIFGRGFVHETKNLRVGTHTITVMWYNKMGAVVRRVFTVKIAPTSSLPSTERSVSYGGVTWEFDKAYLTGRFVTGEHYVVAPNGVTITRITPGWDGTKNGTEINPSGSSRGSRQGFDKRVSNTTYDSSLNVADNLPLFVGPNSSVVSSRGLNSKSSRGFWIDDVAVLTVLPQAPPAYSFRPPYAGTDKRILGGRSDVDYSFLKKLPHPNYMKGPSSRLKNVLLDLLSRWSNSDLKTEQGEHSYGRQIAYAVADTALWLNLDHPFAEKQLVMHDVIQRGIDVFGSVKSGVEFFPDGGHNLGRKLLLVMAGRALNDDEMISWADGSKRFVFQEDMQHFVVTANFLSLNSHYSASQLGMFEWASNPIGYPELATSEWASLYRDVNGSPNVGIALAAELMGLRTAWNYEPFFRYLESRYWPREQENRSNSLNRIYLFHAEMWDRHKK